MEISQAVEFLSLYERMLGLLGIWPHNLKDVRLTFILGFLIIHICSEYADLIQVVNSLEHVVANLTQSIPFTVVVLKVILLRWNSRALGAVIETVNDDFREANYETTTEKRIFLARYEKARRIACVITPLVFFAAFYMYLAPLIDLLGTLNKNGTVELKFPYHMRTFYDMTIVRNYALTYVVHLPIVIFAAIGYTGPDCLVITLMLHICGQLSILVKRINNLSTDRRECGPAIKKLVKMHVRLISMTMSLEEAYSLILLSQVFGGMLLICVLPYDLSLRMKEGQSVISADFFDFLSYISNNILLLYAFCYVGESLIEESERVHRAFSECGWEEMPTRHANSIIICMAKSQQPLGLTAGKFYTLSLNSFTGMMKTSMTYFSVLRSLM